jgi:membrane dipeptidase
LYENSLHVDIKRMLEAGNFVQFFAAWVDRVDNKDDELLKSIRMLDRMHQEAELYKDYISICRNYRDIEKAFKENKAAAILAIENGGAFHGELSALRMFHAYGVRCVALTWNYRNEIADGVKDGSSSGGLTPFGREVVKEMNRLGMLVDISHISERGFWDTIGLTEAPLIASHSNAIAICDNPRNLTDEQIVAIKKNGGVIGVNFFPIFLNSTYKTTIDDVVKHIEHIVSLIGEDHIGLGSDFDGIKYMPEGLKGVEDIHNLFERLLALNYSQAFVEKLAGENFIRVIKKVLK